VKHARDRRGEDRRKSDCPRAGLHERRRRPERRSLQVREVSYGEWAAYASARPKERSSPAEVLPPAEKSPAASRFRERAAQDRRRTDVGSPAGSEERRQRTERRMLDVCEIVSCAELLRLTRRPK
jgi:hypothetical protein